MEDSARTYLLLDKRAEDLVQKGEATKRDHFDTNGIAKWLGVSVSFVEKGRSQGYGPRFEKLGQRCIRYYKSDVLAWLRERSYKSTHGSRRV